jgi:Sulfotransferase family
MTTKSQSNVSDIIHHARNFLLENHLSSIFRRKNDQKKMPSITTSWVLGIGIFVFVTVLGSIHIGMVQKHYERKRDMIGMKYTNHDESMIGIISMDSVSSFSREIKSNSGIPLDIVMEDDYIYKERIALGWDSSPVVIESHKLIFFTIPKVGCTVWKQLFRRMEGANDWYSQDWIKMLPHNPEKNGLKYLYNYSNEEANIMMTSPEWTRAMMIREPKIRLLSAFLDKAVAGDHIHIKRHCCKIKPLVYNESCVESALSVPGFLNLITTCHDEHWRLQNERIDAKYWPYITHILHLENAQHDAKELLQSIGAWEQYGNNGWGSIGIGDHTNIAIFEKNDGNNSGTHTRNAKGRIWQYFTPELERKIEQFYHDDYMNPLFNFTRGICLTCEKS